MSYLYLFSMLQGKITGNAHAHSFHRPSDGKVNIINKCIKGETKYWVSEFAVTQCLPAG